MMAYLIRNMKELINKSICFCGGNPHIFICKHHKQRTAVAESEWGLAAG
jgi:hypothetical protein